MWLAHPLSSHQTRNCDRFIALNCENKEAGIGKKDAFTEFFLKIKGDT